MNEKIAAALKSIEGASAGPWVIKHLAEEQPTNPVEVFATFDGKPQQCVVARAYSWTGDGRVERDHARLRELRWDEAMANAEQVALSPALGAALRLAAAVEHTVDEMTQREHGDVWCGDCLQLEADWPSSNCVTCDNRVALDAFLAALPEVEK